MSSSDAEFSQDQIFDLLSNRRRRYVLNFLLRVDRPVSIQELSKELATWEFDVDQEDLTDQQEKRIYVALYQTHIPKLEDAGVIEYDSDAGLVELTDDAQRLQPYVEEEIQARRPWPWYYLAVASVGLLVYAGVVFDLLPLGAVTTIQAGVAIFAAFMALAAYHYWETAR